MDAHSFGPKAINMKELVLMYHWLTVLAASVVRFCRSLLQGFACLVYPPFCLTCEEKLTAGERIVCDRCWSSFEFIDRPLCEICGAPLKRGKHTCHRCSDGSFSFGAARASYLYTERVRRVVHAFKFQRKTSLAQRLGRGLAFTVINDARFRQADCLIPVPLHISRLRERGYNQSDFLAEGIAVELGVPCRRGILMRKKKTKAMTALTPERRQRNVEHAFEVVAGADMKGKHIVLVDDVFTTGATVEACTRVLLQAGIAEVNVLTVARAF